MRRDVAIVAGAALGAYALASGWQLLVTAVDGWVWPVPSWDGRDAVISDGFSREATSSHRKHLGVDLMFQRRTLADASSWPANNHDGTRWFFMPGNMPAVAARGGRLWNASRSERGYQVVIDHGPSSPYSTYYQHLDRLLVPETSGGRGGIDIAVGQAIGVIGGDVSDGANPVRHLHFELRQGGAADAVDPQLVMAFWGRVRLAEGGVG
jgi:murein DD-endopeptidase MepM/ murein hydrolase activator NlpD